MKEKKRVKRVNKERNGKDIRTIQIGKDTENIDREYRYRKYRQGKEKRAGIRLVRDKRGDRKQRKLEGGKRRMRVERKNRKKNKRKRNCVEKERNERE